MTKKRKIILISLAVALALAVGVGGFVYAENNNHYHEETGGNKLLGVGEMGYFQIPPDVPPPGVNTERKWDTRFIVTNPNCERDLAIEWVALIASEDVYEYDDGDGPEWYAEEVIFEGTPLDWYFYLDIEIPGNWDSELGVLSPHEAWQVSITEIIAAIEGRAPLWVLNNYDLSKYTLEITWSGARYSGWWWWGYWRSGRPLTGWQKETCQYWVREPPITNGRHFGFAISEVEMEVFPSRRPFQVPDWWEEPPPF